MTTYIQRNGDGYLETVDEFETMREARAMLAEYRLADQSADYYLSSRACKDWRESSQPAIEITEHPLSDFEHVTI